MVIITSHLSRQLLDIRNLSSSSDVARFFKRRTLEFCICNLLTNAFGGVHPNEYSSACLLRDWDVSNIKLLYNQMAHQSGMYSRCHNIFFMSSEIVYHNHFLKETKTSKSNQQIFSQKNNFYL